MSQISQAIKAKEAQIRKLQADIDALQRVVSIIGGKKPAAAKSKRRRRKMSAAARKAVSTRMKAYWAAKQKTGN